MTDDLAAELPQVKPWEQRANGVLPLAGGYERYFDTLAWILQQCRDDRLDQDELQQRYMAAYSLDAYVALVQIQVLQKYGLLEKTPDRIALTSPSARWLETRRADFVVGTMHANLRLVGELIHEVRLPRTRKSLLKTANDRYGFGWQKDSQIAYRLGWLRSAGFAQQKPGNTYQATDAGLSFLDRIKLYRPNELTTVSVDDLGVQPPVREGGSVHEGNGTEGGELPTDESHPIRPEPKSPRSLATDIAQRLIQCANDGARHKEFEEAVRDAFAFLGFEAQLLSGAGQTDVLVSGVRQPADGDDRTANRWRYKAVVDAKAVSKGKLTSGQVTWPAIEKHRKLHQAEYALLVGPEPSGQLLDFATSARIGVLAAELLAELVARHALVPLPLPEYQALFADENDQPRGGTVDLVPIEAARAEHEHRRGLLVGACRAVSNVAESGSATATAQVVQFALSQNGIASRLGDVDAALELLANPWLDAIGFRGERPNRDYLPTAAPRVVAARLRWLADAFDEASDASAEPSSSG